MTLNRYTKVVRDYPERGRHLLFHTLNHGMIEVDGPTLSFIESRPSAGSRATPESRPKARTLRTLKKMRFLVKDKSAERKGVDRYFSELKKEAKSVVQATVLTTYDCNFACTYCVEEGVLSPVYMDRATAVKSAEYIVSQARRIGAKTIYIMFYGGEPLLNVPAIEIVSNRIRELIRGKRTYFAFAITTNGALLTRDVVDKLIPYGLDGVKVTLDGNKTCHNAKRPFKDGTGSFDTIVANIKYAAEKVRLDVGGNFDADNFDSFPELLRILKARGLKENLDKVSFKPISETPKDRGGLARHSELQCVYAQDCTARRMVELRNRVLSEGFATDPEIGVTICGATMSDAHFTIDPTGVLYKCPALVGHEAFSIGSLESSKAETAPSDLWRRCAGCENVGICGDGCMYGSYIRYGDPERLNCQKSYVDHVVQENIKTWYKDLKQSDRETHSVS